MMIGEFNAARLVIGKGQAAPGAILALAQRARDHATSCGLTVQSLRCSRQGSASRYLTLIDAKGQTWLIRISNHRRPHKSGHGVPHYDLVSIDGVSGYRQLEHYITGIAVGTIPWHPFPSSPCSKQHRRAKPVVRGNLVARVR